jgi:hypothetical protein
MDFPRFPSSQEAGVEGIEKKDRQNEQSGEK